MTEDTGELLEEIEEKKEPEMQKKTGISLKSLGRYGRGGDSYQIVAERQNFIIIWGCRPSRSVEAKTNMVNEIAQVMRDRFDRDNLSLYIP